MKKLTLHQYRTLDLIANARTKSIDSFAVSGHALKQLIEIDAVKVDSSQRVSLTVIGEELYTENKKLRDQPTLLSYKELSKAQLRILSEHFVSNTPCIIESSRYQNSHLRRSYQILINKNLLEEVVENRYRPTKAGIEVYRKYVQDFS